MEKTSPQGKQQAIKSTTEEEEMCDKAGDSSLDGIVDSSAASFNTYSKSFGDCKEMFLKMSFLNPFPNPGERDPVLHDFIMRRSRSSLAEHMPVKLLISPTDFNDDSLWNWDEMMIHPREDAKFIQAKQT